MVTFSITYFLILLLRISRFNSHILHDCLDMVLFYDFGLESYSFNSILQKDSHSYFSYNYIKLDD